MHSSTSSSDRPIPKLPFAGIALSVVAIVVLATIGWELHCRSIGYVASINDTEVLWAKRRAAVRPESVVIIGDSRPFFDLDLDELEKGLGARPIQLALPGSCVYPILADLAKDTKFHGTIICSIVPGMFFAPGGPLMENSQKALKQYYNPSLAPKWGHYLSRPLEEHFAFLNQDDLTLAVLLSKIPISNRPNALLPPTFPPSFCTLDRERRARMTDACAKPGELQTRIQHIWLPLFTPPPPPTFVPKDVFMANMGKAFETRFKDGVAAVAQLKARGAKIIFVRFPMSGELRQLEDKLTPKDKIWDPFVKSSGAPGIYFSDYPELSSFECPEWSHLSAPDSVEFTKRLVPHLRKGLAL